MNTWPRSLVDKIERGSTADGCWRWLGSVDARDGYGRYGRGRPLAHRVVYLLAHPEVDPRLVRLVRICALRTCVNPEHYSAQERGAGTPVRGLSKPRLVDARGGGGNEWQSAPESWPDRFTKKVRLSGPDDCWEWTAGCNREGVGYYHLGRRSKPRSAPARRVGYMLANPEMDMDGLVVSPTSCRNNLCVNPNHMAALSEVEKGLNRADAPEVTGKCRAGLHDWVPANIRRQSNPTEGHPEGGFGCRACSRERHKAARADRPTEESAE